jgi:membrane protein DedA with SNARE-associated domain
VTGGIVILAVGLVRVQGWMEAGGYAAILLVLLGCGLGLPVPEDVPLILSGAMAAQGKMDLVLASGCCWVGIIGGDCILYWLARRYGMAVTKMPLVGRHMTAGRVEKLSGLFRKYGIWVVAGCRLVAGVRAAMVAAAGVTRYSFPRVVVADSAASLVSGGLFIALGYWCGSRLPWLVEQIKQWQRGVTLGLALAVVLGTALWFWRRRRSRRAAEKSAAERETESVVM